MLLSKEVLLNKGLLCGDISLADEKETSIVNLLASK